MVSFDVAKLAELLRTVVREEIQKVKEERVDRFYTIKELSDLLNISVSTIHRRKDKGLIPYHQDGGGKLTFHHNDIQQMIQKNRRGSNTN